MPQTEHISAVIGWCYKIYNNFRPRCRNINMRAVTGWFYKMHTAAFDQGRRKVNTCAVTGWFYKIHKHSSYSASIPQQGVHRDADSTTYQSSYQQAWRNASVCVGTGWFYNTHTHTHTHIIVIDQCAATWGHVPTGWLNYYTCPVTWIMRVVIGPFYKIQYGALQDSACRQIETNEIHFYVENIIQKLI